MHINKRILTFVIGILLITLVTSSIYLANFEIEKRKQDNLKETDRIQEIEVYFGDIICNDVECFAKVYQKDLINTEWRGSLYNEKGKKKTKEILSKELQEWASSRISHYADTQLTRKQEISTRNKEVILNGTKKAEDKISIEK
jgi:hypothetical protein